MVDLLTNPFEAALAGGLVLGFFNSLHCAFMCGPLVGCAGGGVASGVGYHTGRTVAYGVTGLIAGGIGGAFDVGRLHGGGAGFAFALAAIMIAVAFGVGRGVTPSAGRARWFHRLWRRITALPPGLRGVVLGTITPLLPCGLLYAALALAVASGSAIGGTAVMVGFSCGIVPALVLAQWQLHRVQRRLGARGVARLAQGVMLVAAAVLVWRGVAEITAGPAACCAHEVHAE